MALRAAILVGLLASLKVAVRQHFIMALALAFKSAVVAARFLIDAWRCGWGVLWTSVSPERADAVNGPSTPASSLFQKNAENTMQAVIDGILDLSRCNRI
jgi:hypothetical protein